MFWNAEQPSLRFVVVSEFERFPITVSTSAARNGVT